MRVVLRVTSESQYGRQVWLRPGQSIRIGRTEATDFAFPDDDSLAEEHFAIELSADKCWLRDLSSKGTYVNGNVVLARSELSNGDAIAAGNTSFELVVEGATAVDSIKDQTELELTSEELTKRLIEYFRSLPQPLFAILDAAQDPMALALLLQCDIEHQSLYEGVKGERLAAVAPYLVGLPPAADLLETLIAQGWGRNWGVYLTSGASFKEVRKNLRRLLVVKTDEGKHFYFRFYDPRVMRAFLPTCQDDEAQKFFDVIESFVLEGDVATQVLHFDPRSYSLGGTVTDIREMQSDYVDHSP